MPDTASRPQILQSPSRVRIINPYREIVTRGLVGWWPYLDGPQSTTQDASGSGHTGTLVNMEGADWTTGPSGLTALTLDGTNERIENGSWHASSGDLTACVWVKFSSLPTAGNNYWSLIGRWDTGANKRSWQLDARYATSGTYSGIIFAAIVDQTGNQTDYSLVYSHDYTASNPTVTTGVWYHVCMRFVAATGVVSVFVDGADASVSLSRLSNASAPYDGTGVNVTVGCNYTNGTAQRFVAGQVADPRVYAAALLDAEIAAIVTGRG